MYVHRWVLSSCMAKAYLRLRWTLSEIVVLQQASQESVVSGTPSRIRVHTYLMKIQCFRSTSPSPSPPLLQPLGHPPPSLVNPGPHSTQPISPPRTLSVICTSLFGVAHRDFAPIDVETSDKIVQMVQGRLAVLSLPVFKLPQLQVILHALECSAPRPKSLTAEELTHAAALKAQDPPNLGQRVKRCASFTN